MATFSADFSSGIGAEWTVTDWGITLAATGGGVGATSGSAWTDGSMYCNQVSTANHKASVKLLAGIHNFQLAVRASSGTAWRFGSGTGTCYMFELSGIGGTGTLYRTNNATWTSLGTWDDASYSAGQTAELEANGSTITVRRNGTQVLQVTDTAVTAGTITGMKNTIAALDTAYMDDWSCQDISTDATVSAPTTVAATAAVDGSGWATRDSLIVPGGESKQGIWA